jgi:phosphoribosylaminoimidazole-succinocarboxamide synthase
MELANWTHDYSGKVRDLYTSPGHPNRVLMVASDRVSAFDHVLSPAIPGKGALLTKLSLWWFEQLDGMPNHLAPADEWPEIPAEVADRSMLVKSLDMFPIECVVRGYLSGSGWLEYQKTQSVCGVALPAGLLDGDRLPAPIYTPAWKAPLGEHDENITFERTVELVGEVTASALRDLSLTVFERASVIAEARGVILADTKFEFGVTPDGIVLADEVLTPDSSRYWPADQYAPGGPQPSFDKQFVRDYLEQIQWNKQAPAPALPDDIVAKTQRKYLDAYRLLTGRELDLG